MEPRTIEEFGEQWSRFQDLGGRFGSSAFLQDLCGPLLPLGEIAGRRVLEIGSGNGRIVRMLLDAGAAHVTAVEPSAGIEVLKRNGSTLAVASGLKPGERLFTKDPTLQTEEKK